MSSVLFEPYALGEMKLANRMVMAPMTRNRSNRDGTVPSMMATYYQQRATAGLIITESTPVSPEAIGYPFTPGLFNDAHVTSWRHLVDAVHGQGGHIFVQLQHCGRISHPKLQPDSALPVAPTALRPTGQAVTYDGMLDFVMPRALKTNEIPLVVQHFQNAADLAKQAGFDGVEVHGANGYLIDQFLRDGSNHREDGYGGSLPNRMRFLNEILDAVSVIWPRHRIGVRLSPENSFNSMSDSAPQAHFNYIADQLRNRGLAYMHVLEGDMMKKRRNFDYAELRQKFGGTYIANNGYDFTRAQMALRDGLADMIAFGVPFLANPDLVRRYKEGLTLNQADPSTFYGGGEAGYINYPEYAGTRAFPA